MGSLGFEIFFLSDVIAVIGFDPFNPRHRALGHNLKIQFHFPCLQKRLGKNHHL